MEIGQVGQAGSSTNHSFTFYSHAMKEAPHGDAAELAQALQEAAATTEALQVEGLYLSCLKLVQVHTFCLPFARQQVVQNKRLLHPLGFCAVVVLILSPTSA